MNLSRARNIAALTFLLLCGNGTAWTQSSLTAGLSVSSGTRSFPLNSRFGVGGSLQYAFQLSIQSGIRFYAGYDRFKHNLPNIDPRIIQDSFGNMRINGRNIKLIPFRVGYQHFLFENAVFVNAEAGLSHLFTRGKYYRTHYSDNLFTYAMGTGYNFKFQRARLAQLSLFYNCNRIDKYGSLNYFSLRAAYGLAFGRTKK